MSWIIVNFNKENKVDAVPETWYNKENNQCYWPAKKLSHKIAEYIRNEREPDESWKLFDATLLGLYEDFNYAQHKAKKAQTTDRLTSNDESLFIKKNKSNPEMSKKTKKSQVTSNSSNSEISSDDDSNEYPVQFDKFAAFTKKKSMEAKRTVHTNSVSSVEINKAVPEYKKMKTMKIHQFLEFTKGQNQCLKDINLLHIKIDAISESISSLMKNFSNTIAKPTNLSSEPLPILKLLPMDSEGLIQVEEWLQTEQNKQNLVAELNKIGGPTVKEVVKRVMYRLFQNSLGMEYSWEGKRKKKVFKSLSISSVIIDVVRANKNTTDCSEFEIIEIIKSWLVRSKERFYNNNKTSENGILKRSQTESKETEQEISTEQNEPNEEQIIE